MKIDRRKIFWYRTSNNIKNMDCDCACEMHPSTFHESEVEDIDNLYVPELFKTSFDRDKYILHGKASGIDIVNKNALDFIENFDEHKKSINKKLIRLLLQRGLLAHAKRKPKAQYKTLSAWLHVSNDCNLSCSYCYLNKSKAHMSLETGLKAVRAVFKEALNNGFKEVKLKYSGGEALLNFPVLVAMQKEALALSQELDLSLHTVLLTNGTLFTNEIIQKLHDLNVLVMVSVDGLHEYHTKLRHQNKSHFEKILQNIEKLKAQGILSNISITVTDKNIEGLPEFVAFCLQKDYHFNINFYREDAATENSGLSLPEKKIIRYMRETYRIIEKNLPNRNLLSTLLDRVDLNTPHEFTCGAGINYLVIDHNGEVSKCQMQIGKNKQLTNINQSDLLDKLRNKGFKSVSVNEKTECKSCDIKYFCAGGCPLIASLNGNSYQRSPYCNIYKSLYKDVLRLEAKRIIKYEKPYVIAP